MWNKILSFNWTYAVLVVLGIRAVIEASLPQALIVACFSGLAAYNEYLKFKKPKDLSLDVKSQLDEMKATVAGLAMKNAAKPAQMEQQVRRFF